VDKKTAGLLLVLGVAAAATVLMPRLTKLKSPANSAGRAATRTGLMLYGKTREVMSEMGEIVDDLVAEVEASVAAAEAGATDAAAESSASANEAADEAAAAAASDTSAGAENAAEAAAGADAPRSAA
jgi:hypothetical protein